MNREPDNGCSPGALLKPGELAPRAQDRELFDRLLRGFVPERAFDIHAHLYRVSHLGRDAIASVDDDDDNADDVVGWDVYRRHMGAWMGDRAPEAGLFFPFPAREVDARVANGFCVTEADRAPNSRALMLVRPEDDAADVEAQLEEYGTGVAGFKVYHVFAARSDTISAAIGEFLPEWVWEIADNRRLLIMLHVVRARALTDPENQRYLREHCARYSDARLMLAHAGRGFCSLHTVEGVGPLAGLDNVFFDTSAVCEPTAMLAVLQACGPRRLLFGSDFPVSNHQGRSSSLGDGFFWLQDDNVEWSGGNLGQRTLVGIESLLALKQACRLAHLTDTDIQRVFRTNAEGLLGLNWPTNAVGQSIYERARNIIPGGTQLLSKRPEMYAPGHWPPYFAEARGVRIVDADDRELIDMSTMSVGACLLGYSDPDVNAAVSRRVMLGSMASLNSSDEVALAERLVELHPWAQMVRYARGGGEAMAIAVRIARAATGRSKVAFCGYHGWHDWYLAANRTPAGSADRLAGHSLGGLDATGVPVELAGTTLPFTYNCLDELETLVGAHGNELAAIVMEPTRSQEPAPGFLQGVRELADRTGAVLVFDEISVGWRLCLGGAHLRYGVQPDVAVFSKAMANGYPMAAIIGIASVMQAAQQTFISSTMWTDGIGPAAALATIEKLQRENVPAHVASIGARYRQGLQNAADRHGLRIRFTGHEAISVLGFEHEHPAELQTLLTLRMLEQGFLVAAGFYPSLAHQAQHVDHCVNAADGVFRELREAIERRDIAARIGGKVKHSGFARLA